MNQETPLLKKSNLIAKYEATAHQRSKAYQRGYSDGDNCVAYLNMPHMPSDVIAYVQGYIQGTYDRVSANSGDYLTF